MLDLLLYSFVCRFGGGDGHSTIAGTALYMAPEVMQAGGDIDVNAVASQQQQQHQHQIHQQHQPKQQVASGLVVDLALDLASESNNTSDVHIESRNNNNSNRRKKGYGKRADVWSMGITLCEMATGKAPFTSAGAAIFAVCVSKKFPAFPDVFSPEAHEFLNRLVHCFNIRHNPCTRPLVLLFK